MSNCIIINNKKFDLYLDEIQIQEIVNKMALRIREDYSNKVPYFIIILKGAVFFASDLIRAVELDCRIDIIRAKSYGSEMNSGDLQIQYLNDNLTDKDIIIIEDIIDTGKTLSALITHLKQHNPASIEIASLLSKIPPSNLDFRAKYIGKDIDNMFVIGYGLDFDEQGRHLKNVYILSE